MIILILICMLLTCGGVEAQQRIDFDDALTIMLENNRQLRGAQHNVEVAQLERRAAVGLRLPRIDLYGAYVYMQRSVDIELGGAKGAVTESIESLINKGVAGGIISPDFATVIGGTLSPLLSADWRYTLQQRSFGGVAATLQMPIYTGGRINIANRAAKLKVESANVAMGAIEGELLVTLVKRYYGVVLAKALCDVRREALSSVKQHLYDAQAMFDEGILQRSVVLYLEYKMSEAQRDVESAEHTLAVAQLALKSLLNVDYEVEPSVKLFLCNNIQSVDYYVDMANNLNPILCQANIDRQLAAEGVKLARAALLPEVVALGAVNIYNYQVSDMVPRWAVGVGLNLTLFDGLSKEYKYKAAKEFESKVVDIVENAKSEIALLVEKEYYEMVNAKNDIYACKLSITFAEEYYKSMCTGFAEGVTSATEAMDAQVELSASKVKYLNAAFDYCVALAKLLNVAGLSSTFLEYKNMGEVIDIN